MPRLVPIQLSDTSITVDWGYCCVIGLIFCHPGFRKTMGCVAKRMLLANAAFFHWFNIVL